MCFKIIYLMFVCQPNIVLVCMQSSKVNSRPIVFVISNFTDKQQFKLENQYLGRSLLVTVEKTETTQIGLILLYKYINILLLFYYFFCLKKNLNLRNFWLQ